MLPTFQVMRYALLSALNFNQQMPRDILSKIYNIIVTKEISILRQGSGVMKLKFRLVWWNMTQIT